MKKVFSTIAVCITMIFVSFMVKINNEIDVDNTVINNQKAETVNKNQKSNDEKLKKNEDNSAKKKIDESIKSNEVKKAEEKKNELNNADIKDKQIKDQSENSPKTEDAEKKDEKTAAVFKVDKNTIASRVSFEDKARLLIYSRKLSTADEARIKELMKSSDELNSSIKIFKILKLRLDPGDYNSVKKILSPYIDVNLIENNLK